MYDPSVGQWLSEDPIGFGAGDPNTRRFAHNDPVNFVDPTGLADENYGAMRNLSARYGVGDQVRVHHIIRQEFFKEGHELAEWLQSHGYTRDDLGNLMYLPNEKALSNGYVGDRALHLGGHTGDSAQRISKALGSLKERELKGAIDKAGARAEIAEIQAGERMALRTGEVQLHAEATLMSRRAAYAKRSGRFVLPFAEEEVVAGDALRRGSTRGFLAEGLGHPVVGVAADAIFADLFQYQSLGTHIKDDTDIGVGLAQYAVPANPYLPPLAPVIDISRPPLIPIGNFMREWDKLEGRRQAEYIEAVYENVLKGSDVSTAGIPKARAYMEARVMALSMNWRSRLTRSEHLELQGALCAGTPAERDPERLYNKYILRVDCPTFKEIQESRSRWQWLPIIVGASKPNLLLSPPSMGSGNEGN